jgi:type IV secretion system protein VirB10
MSEAAPAAEGPIDARPLVARAQSNRGVLIFAGIAALGAVALFATLEARRNNASPSAIGPVAVSGEGTIQPPPPLVIPQTQGPFAPGPGGPAPQTFALARPQPPAVSAPPAVLRPAPAQQSVPPYFAAQQAPQVVVPATVYQAPAAPAAIQDALGRDGQRVKAGYFDKPAMTVPQGAVVQAVLETALDSTRAGPARAIVSRDVRGFDGSNVLIPRGSRLYGEYKADLSTGQKRALIQWTRLMRPDGVVIALDSPSADPLGRAGVGGKVNTHFFERFGGAFLQSALDLGVAAATREATGSTVIVGLPGSTQSVPIQQPEAIRPTLKVAQGTPVSVFVARDLDFSEVGR